MNKNLPILFLAKQDAWSNYAAHIMRIYFGESIIVAQGKVGDALPEAFAASRFGAIISFLSPWIIPAEILEKSELSLNFHPGSCDYPGIGCYNFALYEDAKTFGAVCHYMLPKVDSGLVVCETLFPVMPNDRVETLKLRTMIAMTAMFQDIIARLALNIPLPENDRQWTRPAFTRKQLNALCEITPQMSEEEKSRRIRATTYPNYPGPYLLENGEKKLYPVPTGSPIA